MKTPWEYFENIKDKKWNELTTEEQNRLILAIQIVQDDLGVIPNSEDVIRTYLSTNLPIEDLPVELK